MLKIKAKKKKNLDRVKLELDKLAKINSKPSRVRVGIPDDSITYPDGTSLLLVAIVQEFGTFDGRIPERSFLRAMIVENKNFFKKFWDKHAEAILTGKVDPKLVLELLGQMAEAKAKEKVVSLSDPANAPSTVRAKGSSNPLVDTGLLLGSIRYEVDK